VQEWRIKERFIISDSSCTKKGSSRKRVMRLMIRMSAKLIDVGIEVLTAVVMKSSFFWDITPCSQLEDNRHFGEIHHLQSAYHLLSRWYFPRLI
jgi:hypothetical protein